MDEPLVFSEESCFGVHRAAAHIGQGEVRARHGAEIERRIRSAARADGEIGEMLSYHLATGGKRIRAFVPVWVCENLGGDPESALDLGVGLELLHNATLIHDDLQDGDKRRRGQPTVWHKWGAAQAVNAGDALVFQAFRSIARAPDAAQLFDPICDALLRVVEGQAAELSFQRSNGETAPALDSWRTMARRKTGALLGACMRAGAVAAGARAAVVESAALFGEDVGVLFQVQDDYLDLVGDKGRERRGGDLIEGKLSFPIVWAFENGGAEADGDIRRILRVPRADRTWAMVDDAIGALELCGALDATAAWLQVEADRALHQAMAEIVPGWIHECLAPVAHALG